MTRRSHVALAGTLAGVVFASCGGQRTSAIAPVASAHAAPAMSSVQMQLTIPKRVAVASGRVAQYVSPSTASVVVTVTPGNVTTTVTLGASNCVSNGAGTAQVCTFAVSAPVGNDTFSLVAYDLTAHPLSAATAFTSTVLEGRANTTIPLIMGGIPATMDVTFPGGAKTVTLAGGSSSRTALTVTVYDAASNIIVGPGAYVTTGGALAPIVLSSQNGNANFGYSVTPNGSTTPGAAGATVTLNEPGDSVALAYNGSAWVPPQDSLTYPAGLTTHTGGPNTVESYTFGWRFTPPFTPALLLPEYGSVPLAGHQGIVIADRVNQLGFVGDTTATCTVPPSTGASPVTRIGGITFNANTSDANVYAWVSDPSESQGIGLDRIALASVIAQSCTLGASAAAPVGSGTPQGTAAAANKLFADLATGGVDYIESFNVAGALTTSADGLINNSGTSFTTHSVAVSSDGNDEYVQFGEKHFVTAIAFGGTTGPTQPLGNFTDAFYPGGVAVDAYGDVYVNDSNASVFGSTGGIDAFTAGLAAANGTAQLNAPLVQSGPLGALQNIAVAPYGSFNAIFAAATDGVEIFPVMNGINIGTRIAPAQTIVTPATPVSLVGNNDNRVWVLLNDGTIDVLPPF